MNRRLQTGAFLVVAAVAGFAGYYLNQASLRSAATELATQKLMLVALADLDDKTQTLSQWRGQVLVVNFWATWCPPCREEIPALKKIHSKYVLNSVKIVGIALDNASKVRDYADEMSIDYSLLIGGAEILDSSKDLGNQEGVLPFTVVLDRAGKVAFTHTGALTEASLDAVLRRIL